MDFLKEIKEIWSMVQDRMKQQLSSTAMNLWFGDIEIISFSENTLTMVTTSEFKMNIIKDKYIAQLEEIFTDFMGFRIKIVVESKNPSVDIDKIRNQLANEDMLPERERDREDREDKQPVLGSTMPTVNFEYTFDNFIVGSSNKFAHAACIAVADRPAQDYNPLFIYGPSGLGKTHLLYAVTNEIKTKNPFANIIYIKGEDFTNQMIESLAKKSMAKFRDKYRTCDVLLIDDIQFLAGKEQTQEEFFHTFSALYEAEKLIILTSDRPPKEINPLMERLRTRFEWGLIADIQPPSFELRTAIIKKKSDDIGLTISQNLIDYIAERLNNNIRQIEGILKKLYAIHSFTGSEITKESIDNIISIVDPGNIPNDAMVEKILLHVSKKYGVSIEDIKSKKKTNSIANARHVSAYVIRKMTDLSLKEIGRVFGRDYSTVISSINKIELNIRTVKNYESEINMLIKEIRGV